MRPCKVRVDNYEGTRYHTTRVFPSQVPDNIKEGHVVKFSWMPWTKYTIIEIE